MSLNFECYLCIPTLAFLPTYIFSFSLSLYLPFPPSFPPSLLHPLLACLLSLYRPMESSWDHSTRQEVHLGQELLIVASHQDREAAAKLLNLSLLCFQLHHCMYCSLVKTSTYICVEFHIVLPNYSYIFTVRLGNANGSPFICVKYAVY